MNTPLSGASFARAPVDISIPQTGIFLPWQRSAGLRRGLAPLAVLFVFATKGGAIKAAKALAPAVHDTVRIGQAHASFKIAGIGTAQTNTGHEHHPIHKTGGDKHKKDNKKPHPERSPLRRFRRKGDAAHHERLILNALMNKTYCSGESERSNFSPEGEWESDVHSYSASERFFQYVHHTLKHADAGEVIECLAEDALDIRNAPASELWEIAAEITKAWPGKHSETAELMIDALFFGKEEELSPARITLLESVQAHVRAASAAELNRHPSSGVLSAVYYHGINTTQSCKKALDVLADFLLEDEEMQNFPEKDFPEMERTIRDICAISGQSPNCLIAALHSQLNLQDQALDDAPALLAA